MTDPFDIELEDPELQEEIHLMAELMAVATASRDPLPQARIDELLGEQGRGGHERRAAPSLCLVGAGPSHRIPGATQGSARPGRRPADVRSVPRPRDPDA